MKCLHECDYRSLEIEWESEVILFEIIECMDCHKIGSRRFGLEKESWETEK